MYIFHNHEVLQHSWNLHCTSTKIYENFTEGVNSLANQMKNWIWTSDPETKNILWFHFPANPIFSALMFFLDVVGLFTTVIASWNVYMLWQCQLITAIADHCQAKKYRGEICALHLTYPPSSAYETWAAYFIIFCNMFTIDQKNAEQLEMLKIDMAVFSTSFRLQASAVPVNEVK